MLIGSKRCLTGMHDPQTFHKTKLRFSKSRFVRSVPSGPHCTALKLHHDCFWRSIAYNEASFLHRVVHYNCFTLTRQKRSAARVLAGSQIRLRDTSPRAGARRAVPTSAHWVGGEELTTTPLTQMRRWQLPARGYRRRSGKTMTAINLRADGFAACP